LRSLAVDSSPARVPAAIVNYVWRTRDSVVLNDATREGRFGTDAYILEHLPKAVLCKPIVKQGVLIGILYLENALTANAFTPDRLEVLDILSAQIAVALENAKLYHEMKRLNADLEKAARKLEDYSRTLEDKVAQRTQELSARNDDLAQTLRRLKDTQTQLITQEKLASLGQLTAGIAHEIKNPLNFVNNFAELSLELIDEMREGFTKQQERIDPPDRAVFEELLSGLEQNSRKINEHGKRADSIVRSMLQHSRGKSGERLEVDINAMLDETLGLAYHGMRAHDPEFNVSIEKNYDQSVGYITVVPQDVSRVFLNIIANSFYEVRKKRAEAGNSFSPALSVQTTNLGARIEVRIRDNGNGIPAHVRENVFNPFFTTKAAGEGTGLGLSLSYDIIVKGHGGELAFDTEEREYTEFIIRLPRDSTSQVQP
jgi:signal transduction histidine kinase